MDKEQLYNLVVDGNANQLEKLLQSGLNVNEQLPNGRTMIFVAAGLGDVRLDITKILVKYGADINTRVGIGVMTLLDWIKDSNYFYDHEKTIAFLESSGAKGIL